MRTNQSVDATSLTLLGRVEACDDEAWSQFVSLYGPLVYNWCQNAGLQSDDRRDVSQNVFSVVSTKLHTFESGTKSTGAFRSWLWGITRLEILKYLRSMKRQPVGQGGTDYNLSLQNLETQDREPESVNGLTAKQLMIKSAIELIQPQFDPRTWQAFWDMAVKGRPAKDIGLELDMTPKAVRQAKFRVTKKIRELLEEDLAEFLQTAERPV